MNTKQANVNQEPEQNRRENSVVSKPRRTDESMPHRSESIDSNKTKNRLANSSRSARGDEHFDDHLLIPERMVNEFVYCSRIAYLEWVQQEREPSAHTVEGTFVHRRVDRQSDVTKQGGGGGEDRPPTYCTCCRAKQRGLKVVPHAISEFVHCSREATGLLP